MNKNICWWLYYFMERNNSDWETVNLLAEGHFSLCKQLCECGTGSIFLKFPLTYSAESQ